MSKEPLEPTGPKAPQPDAKWAELEARLADVEAHRAILDLKSLYGTLADARYTRKGPKSQAEIDEALATFRFDLQKHQSKTDPQAVILAIKGISRV